MPVPSATTWPEGNRELYQAFLRWLEPQGIPPAQARTGYQRRQALLERAVFYVLVDSGLRRSEVVGLTLEDVDLGARRLCVRHAKLQRDRLVYLSARAVRALREYLAVREAATTDRLFVRMGLPLTEASLGGRVQRWGAKAGISLSPHRLRHTYATRLLQLVDQLLQAPASDEERERLLRQMRDLLEPPPEITQPEKEDQEDQ